MATVKETDNKLPTHEDTPMEERILQAAEKLFLDKGFSLTTTTEIAREAGCNQALVHYYFRTKDNLFQTIFEGKVALFIDALMTVEREGTFEEKLTAIIETHFDILNANPKMPLFMVNEISRSPQWIVKLREKLDDIPAELLATFNKELDKEIAKGHIRPIDGLTLILDILSMNVFMFLSWPIIQNLLELPDRDVAALVASRRKEAVAMIIRGLRP